MNSKYHIIEFKSIDSTNTFLKRHYNEYNEFTVCVAEEQTNGKGRIGRTWFSSKDNITLSILLKPQNLENISNISLVAGASVYNTLKEYVNCSIKWPNDILIKDKKICGILLESISSSRIDALVIGIGLNVNQVEFDEEIKNKATSLKRELNMDFNKDEIIKKFINNFDYLYNDFINRGKIYLEIVRSNFYLRDKKAFINNEEVKIIDVEEDGRLKVLKGNVVVFLNSGEVSLEKIYNN